MYFITVDVDGYLTGMYDGSKDYVHRISGTPIEGAKPIPDDAFLIGDMCVDKIRTASPNSKAKWDSVAGCIVQEPLTELEEVQEALKQRNFNSVVVAEEARIEGLTLLEAQTELGA